MHNIDIRNISVGQLQCFVTAAGLNSFSRAAEQLHITQSTVSKAIISLENMMGLQLFLRKGNRLQLTPAGKYVYEHLRKTGTEVEKTLYAASVIQTGLSKNINIACLDSYKPDTVVIPVVDYFKEKHPDVKVAVETMPAQEVRLSLINGESDVVFTVLYDIDELGTDAFQSVLLAKCPHCAFMLKSNPLSKRKSISVTDLKQSDFISISPLRTPSYSASISRLCEEYGFTPNISYFTQSATSLAFNLSTDNEVFIADRFFKDYDNPMIIPMPLKNTKSGLVMGYKSDNDNVTTTRFIEATLEYIAVHRI